MELRTLRYFLAVVHEETICGAADAMHVTQPTLSRQMMELEEKLGKKLFERGKRKISLTEEGRFLSKRAQEILALVQRTEAEFNASVEGISGDVFIGGGETKAMRMIARASRRMHNLYPRVTFHLFSGNAGEVMEKIDRGLVDFGVFVEPVELSKYDFIRLPAKDVWGLLMRRDSPVAEKEFITPEDLADLPLIVSRQEMVGNEISGWMGERRDRMHIIATYNLLYNASLMVEEGVGHALCLDGIIHTTYDSHLCFRPLKPEIAVGICVAWKKHQIFSKATSIFLDYLKNEI